jgi:hypothetical protein
LDSVRRNKKMEKKILSTLIMLILVTTIMVPFVMKVSAAGPNYMGYTPNPKDVTIDDSFRLDVYGDIHREIDTIAADNMTFLPAGVVNYTNTVRGGLFWAAYDAGAETMFKKPLTSGIKNALGYAKPFVWSIDAVGYGRVNNSNSTAFNITWLAINTGTATFTITAGGTAAGGIDPGTTKYVGTVRVHPKTPTSFTATPVHYNQINLAWTKQKASDKTVIVYKTGSNPTSVTDGSVLYNSTGSSTSHSGLSGGDHIYYSAWGWNSTAGFYSLTYGTADGKTNSPPALSSESPTNASINIDKNRATVSVYISDANGNTFNWTIQGAYVTPASANGASNGTKTASLITPLPYDTVIYWYVNATDGIDTTRAVYHFTVRSQYAPNGPSGFDATTFSRTEIDLSWTRGTGADKTYVVAKLGSAPTSRTDGTNIYNGTSSSYPHTGLSPSQHWYYRAYSWNQTDGVYSTAYGEDDAITNSNQIPNSFSGEHPTNNSDYTGVYNEYLNITVTDPDGDGMTVYFYWINGTPIAFTTISSGGQASIFLPSYINPDWLTHDHTYQWYARANDTFGQAQSGTYRYHTSTAWDINEDRSVTYLDASALSSGYGLTGPAGWIGPDIIEDGTVGYLDVSSLSSHYGEGPYGGTW